jgi:hypothetical protein
MRTKFNFKIGFEPEKVDIDNAKQYADH